MGWFVLIVGFVLVAAGVDYVGKNPGVLFLVTFLGSFVVYVCILHDRYKTKGTIVAKAPYGCEITLFALTLRSFLFTAPLSTQLLWALQIVIGIAALGGYAHIKDRPNREARIEIARFKEETENRIKAVNERWPGTFPTPDEFIE